MIANYVLFGLLRVADALLPHLPLRLTYRFAEAAGTGAYLLLKSKREAASRNLARVMGTAPTDPWVRKAVQCAFQNDAKNWADTLRIPRLSDQEIVDRVALEGWEHFQKAAASGKGVVFVTLHLGNFDLVGQLLAVRGYQLTIPVEEMRPSSLFRFLMAHRTARGIRAVPVVDAARPVMRALRSGEVVGVAGDRQRLGQSVPVKLFGQQAHLPRAPLSLSRQTGAELLVGVGVRLGNDQYLGLVTSPVEIQHTDDRHRDDLENAVRLGRTIEEVIRRWPEQWLMFEDFWPRGPGGTG